MQDGGFLPVGGRALQHPQLRDRRSRRGKRQQQGENRPPDYSGHPRRTDHLGKFTLGLGVLITGPPINTTNSLSTPSMLAVSKPSSGAAAIGIVFLPERFGEMRFLQTDLHLHQGLAQNEDG